MNDVAPDLPPVPGSLATAPQRRSSAALRGLFFWLCVGGVLYAFLDQIGPRLLPAMLKRQHASDTTIATLIGTYSALVGLLVTPIVSYRSDRKRSERGRRIPYLLWSVPIAAVFLALIPYAPDLGGERWTIAWFTGLIVCFQVFEFILGTCYFCLIRDVVPETHLGRFLTLFRTTSTCAVFGVSYWLLGLSEAHAKPIFLGVAVIGAVGFWLMCRYVKEPPRPPVPVARVGDSWVRAGVRATRTFVRESFREPVYWWTYLVRSFFYAAAPVTAFVIFFPYRELGLTLDRSGKLLAWASLSWIPIAYVWGQYLDRRGSIRGLQLSLGGMAINCVLSFCYIRGERSFVVFSVIGGAFFWMALVAQLLLANQIFHRERMGQLSAANVIVQSFVIGGLVSPLTGRFLDLLNGYSARWPMPGVGSISVGPYRFTFLILAVIFAVALFATCRVRDHWLAAGGPKNYRAPL